MNTLIGTLALATLLPAGAALAGPVCPPPAAQADSRTGLLRMADDFHWKIDRMEIDDGCYELRVTDVGGNVLKIVVDPATLEVVDGEVKSWGPGN